MGEATTLTFFWMLVEVGWNLFERAKRGREQDLTFWKCFWTEWRLRVQGISKCSRMACSPSPWKMQDHPIQRRTSSSDAQHPPQFPSDLSPLPLDIARLVQDIIRICVYYYQHMRPIYASLYASIPKRKASKALFLSLPPKAAPS